MYVQGHPAVEEAVPLLQLLPHGETDWAWPTEPRINNITMAKKTARIMEVLRPTAPLGLPTFDEPIFRVMEWCARFM